MKMLTVSEAIDQIQQGRQIILVDDEDRENEGDLCMAAEKVTPEGINFMARFGRGLICLTMTREKIERLGLPRMAERNESQFGTNFHVSIEAREGVSTGISAADRAKTILVAVSPDATPQSIVSPGHVFPICAREGGVLVRTGQTEGSVDLARLAGMEPAGVICEIMKDDGTMARRQDLEEFAKQHKLGILTIAQLIEYRMQRETLIKESASANVIPLGLSKEFRLISYESAVSDAQYLALVLGDVAESDVPIYVRMHRASIPGDVFGITKPGVCSKTVRSLQLIEKEGRGVFVYVLPRHIELCEQVARLSGRKTAENGKDRGRELREFGLGAQVLASLGLSKIKLMTDDVKRIVGLEGYGLKVVEYIPLTNRS